jgi:hypothetical protein
VLRLALIGKIMTVHADSKTGRFIRHAALSLLALSGLAIAAPAAAVTVTPLTWNIIGLDSNSPTAGPKHFPVGARICGGTPGASDTATMTWDAGGTDNGTYIYQRAGSANPLSYTYNASGCADAYFEVEVNQTAAAYDQTRRYHITAGGVSTPTPRELYVEHLVSQARNGVTGIKVGPVGGPLASVAAGGSMSLVVGNTYDIELDAFTATQGYSQLESFINFSNVVFQLIAVNTTYSVVSASNSGGVTSPNSYLYSNACNWDNDPTSPYYRSCRGSGNAGGTITTTYTVKILGGGGTSVALNTLAHDFSGSSFHYNADYSVSARYANIIDPAAATIAKSFYPSTTNAGGITTLTFTLTNPNAGALSGLNFSDVFPTSPGAMTLASTTTTNTCGGTLTDENGSALAVGSTGIKLAGGTIPASSSCIVQVVVTPDTTGSYTNTSNHLFVDTLDTGKFATASLTVNTTPPPPPVSSTCAVPVELARWEFGTTTLPPPYTSKATDVATAAASFTTLYGTNTISTAQGQPAVNSWSGTAPTNATTSANGWGEGPTSSANYFQFQLDTSNFGGVNIYFNINLLTTGQWAAPNSNIYIKSSADGGAYTVYEPTPGTYPQAAKASWTALSAPAASTGTSTTTFRISSDGGGNKKPDAAIYLDNVVFTGCTRPDAGLLTISKSFSSSTVAVGGTSTLTFTITNNNPASTSSLTGIGFTDTMPLQTLQGTVAVTNGSATVTGTSSAFKTQLKSGSIVKINGVSYTVSSTASNTSLTLTANYAGATASALSLTSGQTYVSTTSNSCGGTLQDDGGGALASGDSGVKLSGVTLAPGGSCTVAVVVKASSAGALQNVSGFITSTETGDNDSSTGVAKATLTAILPPSISKLFGTNPILANGTSTLTFTITNPNQNDALSGVAFTDTFPAAPGAMTVAAPLTTTNTCGGSLLDNLGGALAAGDAGIRLSAGAIAAGSSCTVTVKVTAATLGSYVNTSGAVSATTAGTGNTASDTLEVTNAHPQIALLKQVSNSPAGPWSSYQALPVGSSVYYQFIVENPGDVDLTSVSVSDPDFGGVVAGCSSVTLAKYDSVTCTAGPVVAVSGVHINTATASGTYSATTYSDVSSAAYVTTNLTLVKSATQTSFTAPGDVLNYSYVVQNTGSATLQGPVTVTDDKTTVTCPAVSTAILTASLPSIVAGDGDNWFDPGEQITCTANYTVQVADVAAKLVTNNATATISGVTSSAASLTIPLAPDLSATKTNNVGGVAAVGGSFNWTITVRNATAAGTATFASGQTLLTDTLPSAGATYALGAVNGAGATGTGAISCAIAGNTLTCSASGGTVVIPAALQGSISVTNGSAALTGSGTSFTTELAAGSIISISGVPYTVSSIADNTSLTLTANYSGATASGIAVSGSFSVPVTVTATAEGSLVNPKSGGMCRADPGAVITEINEANNDCADTVTIQALPAITLLKTVAVHSDPMNLLVNPKFIPGAVAQYAIIASNSGGPADNNSTVVSDALPANTALFVNDIGAAGSGPVLFSQGAPSSTLSYTFTALNDPADDVAFSNDNAATWTYVPVPGADGCDPLVTHLRINPKGTFVGNPTAPSPSFNLNFRACVK